ncbi:MAG: hypothetical protein HIU83_10445 [Proteobacteria bacterium]|nr:hypothetical protein [Pseudomonadota bacterium]
MTDYNLFLNKIISDDVGGNEVNEQGLARGNEVFVSLSVLTCRKRRHNRWVNR